MNAPQPFQLIVLERLHTEAETIDTRGAKTFQLFAIDRLGVRLERHFPIGRNREPRRARVDDGADLVRIEERRRAAAEKDGIGLTIPRQRLRRGRRSVNLFEQRREITRLQRFVVEPSIEVAVVADCGTEGDVDVQAERRGGGTDERTVVKYRLFHQTSLTLFQA